MAVVGLEEQLRGCTEEELAGMCKRLLRSQENLEELHTQLQEDQRQLKEENQKMQEDISLMISCTKPLCIGASNTVSPQLEEGSLDFVGRWWEMMKPRNNAVQINEHVGEIRKDVSALDKDGSKLEVERNEVVGAVQNVWGNLKSSGLFQQGQALAATGIQKARESGAVDASRGAWASLRQTAGSTWAQLNAEPERPKRTKKSTRTRRDKEDRGGYAKNPQGPSQKAVSSNGADGAASAVCVPNDSAAPAFQEANASQSAASASSSADAQPANESSNSPSAEAFEDAPTAERHSVKGAEVETTAQELDEAPEEEEDDENNDEQMSSTVLIEAHLTLGDGTVQIIRVRAADRCKEVAQRFVKEHSLKNLFVQPLTDYLKQVENDAEKFPVSVHADLMEIYGGA
eukprot:gnl/MRDRNA2_/MRDRNA2_107902_c0_seq1.p1 gnl/MRDRNA2_/MRDRNA2_107902_c0~~gnl/MRDRNA2_/MRDRNA2_107902_c0_seq1.p1  ORF type:complete len:402 (+),score=113.13 gnl/MRDRNA2_/MRDRNA2_107902_c0_seq1:70-1275(+)